MKKTGLGKQGLEMLLGGSRALYSDNETSEVQQLRVEQIKPGNYQPRKKFHQDSIVELSQSIKSKGLIQPIIVREISDVSNPQIKYEIIAGERRWQASKLAEFNQIDAIIRKVSDKDVLPLALIENIQREDLNEIDTALGINQLINDFKLSHQQIANILGKSRSVITNLLRLINLSSHVKDLVISGKINHSQARAMVVLNKAQQRKIADQIVKNQLNTRQVENLCKKILASSELNIKSKKIKDINILNLEQNLSEKLNTKVSINHSSNGYGFLKINYADLNDFERLLKIISS